MTILINLIVFGIAILHICFMILEIFFWTKSVGLRIFAQSLEKAKSSATLASNQGLYNGFLAAGLLWSLLIKDPVQAQEIKFFFLGCITIAGLYGGWSVNRKILLIQAAPALTGLLLLLVKINSP